MPMFSRPVSQLSKPAPSDSSVTQRAEVRNSPLSGAMIPASNLSSVVLPAPFLPITPIVSPRETRREMSEMAQFWLSFR